MTAPISAEVPAVRVRPRAERPTLHVELTGRSFETFYRDQRDSIARAIAVTIGDADTAADATDEAMIRAYQRWAHVSTLDRPAAWVFRVGLNHSRSRFRRVKRKLALIAGAGRDEVEHHDQPFTTSFSDDKMAAALHNLSHDHRSVVVLRVLLGFSEREAATVLSVRPGTVKSRLHRALTQLRAQLPHLATDIDELNASTATNASNTADKDES